MKDRQFPALSHIGYIVSDLDADIEAFKKFYGVEEFSVYDFKPMKAWAYGKEIENCYFKIAMGKAQSGIGIELVKPMGDAATPQHDFLKNTEGGINHICYLVEDFEEWREYLVSQPDSYVIYEAEIYDDIRGYRRCVFVRQKGATAVIECAEIPRKNA